MSNRLLRSSAGSATYSLKPLWYYGDGWNRVNLGRFDGALLWQLWNLGRLVV